MSKIIQWIGWFMTIVSAGVIIWQRATIMEKTRDFNSHRDERIEKIEKSAITKEDVARVVDSIIVLRVEPIVVAQNSLRNSYTRFVKDSKQSFDNYIKYLNGIEFELKLPVRDTFKIKIKKVNGN